MQNFLLKNVTSNLKNIYFRNNKYCSIYFFFIFCNIYLLIFHKNTQSS